MRGNGTHRHATNKDLVKEIAALKAQLRKVSTAMEAEAGEGASRALGAIETKSREAIDKAIEAAEEFIDSYAESASDAASALAKKTGQLRDTAANSLVETVQARPLSTLAAIVGIGFIAGYLCRRN
jgi:hypothetical protein